MLKELLDIAHSHDERPGPRTRLVRAAFIERLVEDGDPIPGVTLAVRPWKPTTQTLHEIRAVIWEPINRRLKLRGSRGGLPIDPTTHTYRVGFTSDPIGRPRITLSVPILVGVWILARTAVNGPEGERLAVCSAPGCTRVFLRCNGSRYCSRTCRNRAYWARYPQAKKLRARRRQYEKHGWRVGTRSKD